MNNRLLLALSLFFIFSDIYTSDGHQTNWSKQVQEIITHRAQQYLELLPAPEPELTLHENKLCAFLTKRCTTARSLLLDPSLDRTSEWSTLDAELMKLVHLQALLHDPNARVHYYYARVVTNTLTEVAQIPLDSGREANTERTKIFFTESNGGHLLISHQLSQAILKLLSQQNQESNE